MSDSGRGNVEDQNRRGGRRRHSGCGRHCRQFIERSVLPGCRAGRPRRAVREGGRTAKPHDDPPDRRRRHVRHQGHRSPRPARHDRDDHRWVLSVWPVLGRAAADLADARAKRDRRLQRAERHRLRHAARGGGQAAGRADQGRHGHVCRSRAGGLCHERGGRAKAHRAQGRIRRRGVAVFPGHRADRRHHPCQHRGRARQPDVRA